MSSGITIKRPKGQDMYAQIKNDLDEGIGKIKWFARLLSERVRIELAVFRLTCASEELKKKRDGLLKQIGEEVCRMRKSEKGIHANKYITDALKEIDSLDPRIKETDEKVSDITRITS
jgi:seryl-tRNA synthetase